MAKKAIAKSRTAIEGIAAETATYNLIAPDLKVYAAEYVEATDWSGLQESASRNGISLQELNEAMREVRKQSYKDALSVSNEDKLNEFRKNALAIGMSTEDADAIVEAQRAKMVNSLPTGLSPVLDENGAQKIAKRRGRVAGQKAA